MFKHTNVVMESLREQLADNILASSFGFAIVHGL